MFKSPAAWFPGMTTTEEQTFFYKYALDVYTGRGEIVDLGCFLGATTISLAKGLSERRDAGSLYKRIHVFDQFVWDDYMNAHYTKFLDATLVTGESFFDNFCSNTEAWGKWMRIHPGDLQVLSWNNKPVEFLLIDAMKSWALAKSILTKFFPYLVPMESVVVHQDFKHFAEPWIHLLTYRLREYFTPVYSIPNSSSLVFTYTRSVDPGLLYQDYSYESFSMKEIDAAYDYCLSLLSQNEQANVAAAKVMLFVHRKMTERAAHEFDGFLRKGIPLTDNMIIVKNILAAAA